MAATLNPQGEDSKWVKRGLGISRKVLNWQVFLIKQGGSRLQPMGESAQSQAAEKWQSGQQPGLGSHQVALGRASVNSSLWLNQNACQTCLCPEVDTPGCGAKKS